jgi:hypothetical protein
MKRKITGFLSFLLSFCLIFEQAGFAQVAGSLDISGQIASVHTVFLQDQFRPLHLRSLTYDQRQNNFRLLLDKGDLKDPRDSEVETGTKTLLDYFFVGLTLPDDVFWVNLRPGAGNGAIEARLAKTDVGRILLEADLQLKKDTARFTSPETPEGRQYWDKLYKKAEELFGSENVTIPTLTRPWIVPGEIIIRETPDNAYVYKAALKVMLEQDYLKGSADYNFDNQKLQVLNEYSTQLIRELVIPRITKAVNTARRYAALRQVYYSLILAQWFKTKFKGSAGAYSPLIDSSDLSGLTSQPAWSSSAYFDAYQKSFKDGEYNIQQTVTGSSGQSVRSYFSGGIPFNKLLANAFVMQGTEMRPDADHLVEVAADGGSQGDRFKNIRRIFGTQKPAEPVNQNQGPEEIIRKVKEYAQGNERFLEGLKLIESLRESEEKDKVLAEMRLNDYVALGDFLSSRLKMSSADIGRIFGKIIGNDIQKDRIDRSMALLAKLPADGDKSDNWQITHLLLNTCGKADYAGRFDKFSALADILASAGVSSAAIKGLLFRLSGFENRAVAAADDVAVFIGNCRKAGMSAAIIDRVISGLSSAEFINEDAFRINQTVFSKETVGELFRYIDAVNAVDDKLLWEYEKNKVIAKMFLTEDAPGLISDVLAANAAARFSDLRERLDKIGVIGIKVFSRLLLRSGSREAAEALIGLAGGMVTAYKGLDKKQKNDFQDVVQLLLEELAARPDVVETARALTAVGMGESVVSFLNICGGRSFFVNNPEVRAKAFMRMFFGKSSEETRRNAGRMSQAIGQLVSLIVGFEADLEVNSREIVDRLLEKDDFAERAAQLSILLSVYLKAGWLELMQRHEIGRVLATLAAGEKAYATAEGLDAEAAAGAMSDFVKKLKELGVNQYDGVEKIIAALIAKKDYARRAAKALFFVEELAKIDPALVNSETGDIVAALCARDDYAQAASNLLDFARHSIAKKASGRFDTGAVEHKYTILAFMKELLAKETNGSVITACAYLADYLIYLGVTESSRYAIMRAVVNNKAPGEMADALHHLATELNRMNLVRGSEGAMIEAVSGKEDYADRVEKFSEFKWVLSWNLINGGKETALLFLLQSPDYARRMDDITAFVGKLANEQHVNAFALGMIGIRLLEAPDLAAVIPDCGKLIDVLQKIGITSDSLGFGSSIDAFFRKPGQEVVMTEALIPYIEAHREEIKGLLASFGSISARLKDENHAVSGTYTAVFISECIINGHIFDLFARNEKLTAYSFARYILTDKQYLLTDKEIQDTSRQKLLKQSPAGLIAKIFDINIKLARYLKEKGENQSNVARRLSDPAFKAMVQEIAYNLNREITSHPAEDRMLDDHKTSLFDLIFVFFENHRLAEAKKMFDEFFRNDPEQYNIEIEKLVELLRYVEIKDIRQLIQTVIENPKESLDEIMGAVKQTVKNRPDADFIIRKLEWLVSNLFVLQSKLDLLEPVVLALQKQGKSSAELIELLSQIARVKKFAELATAAGDAGVEVTDILQLKLESISQIGREELIVDALQNIDSFTDGARDDVLQQLLQAFDSQPQESRNRIYLKLLFIQSTDTAAIVKAIGDLTDGREIGIAQKNPSARDFLLSHRAIAAENGLLRDYVKMASALESYAQKEALKALRFLYQERKYSGKGLPADLTGLLSQLNAEIALPDVQTQIPHIFFEPLLRLLPWDLGKKEGLLQSLRRLIVALNANKSVRDRLATMKNQLHEKLVLFSGAQGESTGSLEQRIFELVERKHGGLRVDNCEAGYRDLMVYLDVFLQAVDVNIKSRQNAFSLGKNEELKQLTEQLLNSLLQPKEITDVDIAQLEGTMARFSEIMEGFEIDSLLARLKGKIRLSAEEETATLTKLKKFAERNRGMKWTDHQARDLYKLIDIYLTTIGSNHTVAVADEIYRNIFDALLQEAEGDGKFQEWRYASRDYVETMVAIVEMELAKVAPEEREQMRGKIEQGEKITRIREWEKPLRKTLSDGTEVVFTDDFTTLFNIGNSRLFFACQSCAAGSDLNGGLTGYLVNGTNKAVALLDNKGRVITRRIVRLRMVEDEKGRQQPVIFVEESTQFGTAGISELYGLLETLSRKTGLPLVASQFRPAEAAKVNEGVETICKLVLFRGRSSIDYSDAYGYQMPGHNAGLYIQADPVAKTSDVRVRFNSAPVFPDNAAAAAAVETPKTPANRDGGIFQDRQWQGSRADLNADEKRLIAATVEAMDGSVDTAVGILSGQESPAISPVMAKRYFETKWGRGVDAQRRLMTVLMQENGKKPGLIERLRRERGQSLYERYFAVGTSAMSSLERKGDAALTQYLQAPDFVDLVLVKGERRYDDALVRDAQAYIANNEFAPREAGQIDIKRLKELNKALSGRQKTLSFELGVLARYLSHVEFVRDTFKAEITGRVQYADLFSIKGAFRRPPQEQLGRMAVPVKFTFGELEPGVKGQAAREPGEGIIVDTGKFKGTIALAKTVCHEFGHILSFAKDRDDRPFLSLADWKKIAKEAGFVSVFVGNTMIPLKDFPDDLDKFLNIGYGDWVREESGKLYCYVRGKDYWNAKSEPKYENNGVSVVKYRQGEYWKTTVKESVAVAVAEYLVAPDAARAISGGLGKVIGLLAATMLASQPAGEAQGAASRDGGDLKDIVKATRGCDVEEIDFSRQKQDAIPAMVKAIRDGKGILLRLQNLEEYNEKYGVVPTEALWSLFRLLGIVDIEARDLLARLCVPAAGATLGQRVVFKKDAEGLILREQAIDKRAKDRLISFYRECEYRRVEKTFARLAEILNNTFNNIGGHDVAAKKVSFVVFELLKNAFAHGNRLDFGLPVIIHMRLDKDAKMQSIDVFDTAASARQDTPEKMEAAYGTLHGFRLAVIHLQKNWQYERVTGRGMTRATVSRLDGGRNDARIVGDGGKGGIDFRALPAISQRAGALNLSAAEVARLSAIDADAELARLQKMLNAGVAPSNDRVREYVLACCLKQPQGQGMAKVLGCIASVLRLEEERVVDTDPSLRNLLAVVGSAS